MEEDFANSIYFRFEKRQIISAEPSSFSLISDPNRVFTTFSTVELPSAAGALAVVGFDYHIQRLIDNGTRLGILDPNLDEHQADWIRKTTLGTISRFVATRPKTTARTRLVLNRNGLEVFVGPYSPRWPRGTTIAAAFVKADRAHTDIKSSAISAASDARLEAQSKGAQEAFMVNREGFVTEGSYSNIFWFDHSGKLFTVASGILPGVTRRIILELVPCEEVNITPNELLAVAAEIFVSQSTTAITPVTRLDDTTVSEGKIGPHTSKLQELFWSQAANFSTLIPK